MSESTSFGSSSSNSTIPDFPQAPFLQQLAQYAQMLGQQADQWASGVFAKTSQLTDQVVGNYMQTNAKALQLANNDVQRYQQLFQPQENNLIRDANTFASPDRIKADMGAAESGQMQAADAALQNSRRELMSHGIDPSSGRYAALEAADRTKAAAAAAGAAQQARLADEATGRALRSEAIQIGERYPGQIINSLNTGLQANSGAQSASLGNANTGRNLKSLPNDFLRTASDLKYPPLGNTSASQHSSQSSSDPSGGRSGSGGSGRGGGGSPGYGSSGADGGPGSNWAFADHSNGQEDFGTNRGPLPHLGGGPHTIGGLDGGAGGEDDYASMYSSDPMAGNFPANEWGSFGQGNIKRDYNGGTYDYSGPQDSTYGADSGFNDSPVGFPGGASGGDYSQPSGENSFPSVGDYSGDDTSDSFGGSDYGYAAGGAIPDYSSGGDVPIGDSPSRGAMPDDVQAHVQPDEFVIPRDVALWKGQEFFQKMIMQSRSGMSGAPAKGKPAPAMRQRTQAI